MTADHVFHAWLRAGHDVAGVWTQDVKGMRTRTSGRIAAYADGIRPIGDHIRRRKIPVSKVRRMRDVPDVADRVAATGANTLISVYTGLIVPQEVIDLFGRRAVNFHPALLPHYKGPTPRVGMVFDGRGDEFGGMTMHAISAGIDEGPIIAQRRLPWTESGHFTTWEIAQSRVAAGFVQHELQNYLDGRLQSVPQEPGSGSYRRRNSYEFAVSEKTPLAAVRKYFDCVPGYEFFTRLDRPGKRSQFLTTGLASVLGAPTGKPPVVGRFVIEMDILDARVRLYRRNLAQRASNHPAWRLLVSRLSNSGSVNSTG
ncbi:formyltransferase family protein [Oricola sp.]|uniref:formyltransferase family protein n=1 Tax=Oricola sp. TaxID=1979950 RepID=UPI003BA91A1E